MDKHLDRVRQPDGSYKWELVELRAENLYEKDKPAAPPAPAPRKRRTKAEEPAPESTETTETEI